MPPETRKTLGIQTLVGIAVPSCTLLIVALFRRAGWTAFEPEALAGSFLLHRTGTWASTLGTLLIIGSGAGFSIAYRVIFDSFMKPVTGTRRGIGAGLRLGFAHWLLTGFVLGILPGIHAVVPELIRDPGFFAVREGLPTVITLLAAHLAFGATLGALHHRRPSAAHEREEKLKAA